MAVERLMIPFVVVVGDVFDQAVPMIGRQRNDLQSIACRTVPMKRSMSALRSGECGGKTFAYTGRPMFDMGTVSTAFRRGAKLRPPPLAPA